MEYKYLLFALTFLYLAKTKYKKPKDCFWISCLTRQLKRFKNRGTVVVEGRLQKP